MMAPYKPWNAPRQVTAPWTAADCESCEGSFKESMVKNKMPGHTFIDVIKASVK
jgi:hypothetical protein